MLVKKNQLKEYIQGIWFLIGLPKGIYRKVIRKYIVNKDNPRTVKFNKLKEEVINLYVTKQIVREFAIDNKGIKDRISKLVDQFKLGRILILKVYKFSALIVAPILVVLTSTREGIQDLTKVFKAMALLLRTAS